MEYPEYIQYSIDLLRRAERLALKMQPERGFWLAFSGGKDSQCIYGKAEIRFVRGRLKFGDGLGTAPFASMVVIFRPGDTVITQQSLFDE